MANQITISMDEYETLKEDSRFLSCLQGAGVDNWCGYDDALQTYHYDESDAD